MSGSENNKRPSVKKNYMYSLLYQVTMYIMPLLTTPYISRVFGAVPIGIQSYTTSVTSYFVLFGALGTTIYGQQKIAQSRSDKKECSVLFWEIEFLRGLSTLFALTIFAVYVCWNGEYFLYYMILSLNIIAQIFDISWFFQGQEYFSFVVIRNFFVKISGCILLFATVRRKDQLWLYILILAATALIGNMTMWMGLPGFLIRIDWKELHIGHHIRPTMVYFIPTVATSIYTVLDKVMIGALTSAFDENGFYEQANKVISIGKAVIFSLNSVMLSRVSFYFSQGDGSRAKKALIKTLDFVMFMGVAMSAGLAGIARNFVPWFYGAGYEQVCGLLQVEGLLIPIIGISNCLANSYLTPSGQQNRVNKALIAGAAVNFCLNLALIPTYFSMGAAAASVIAEAIISGICIYLSKTYLDCGELWALLWKKLVAASVMLCYLIIIFNRYRGSVLITCIQIVTGGLLYVAILIVLGDSIMRQFADEMKRIIEKVRGKD